MINVASCFVGNEKSYLPKLTDKVHTLKGIARNGVYAKRLEKTNIHTVGDFLKVYNKDWKKLHQVNIIHISICFELALTWFRKSVAHAIYSLNHM